MTISKENQHSLTTAIFSSIFTLVLLFLINYFFNHSWNPFAASSSKQLFTVEGTSTISQKPDAADISFTVAKSALTLKVAEDQANTSANTIVMNIKKLGIPEKDIKTSNYNSSPTYDNTSTGGVPLEMMPIRGGNGQTITGYTVSESVDVTLSDITKANSVIDVVSNDGAENVSGPNLTFSSTTQDALVTKARLQAVTNAKQKAQGLADAAGIHLGRVVNIQESGNQVPIQPLMMKAGNSNSGGSTPTQINPGENTITETVTLSYQTW